MYIYNILFSIYCIHYIFFKLLIYQFVNIFLDWGKGIKAQICILTVFKVSQVFKTLLILQRNWKNLIPVSGILKTAPPLVEVVVCDVF